MIISFFSYGGFDPDDEDTIPSLPPWPTPTGPRFSISKG